MPENFENWIESQLTPECKEQLHKTPYYQKEKLTITQIVEAYIKHQPTTRQGLVPLTRWFQVYNSITAENLRPKINGKVKYLGSSPGQRYYAQHFRQKKTDQTMIDFESWIEQQLEEDIRNRLEQTPYYIQKRSA